MIALTKLHIDGKYTKNAAGNIVTLRGVNLTTFLDDTAGWFPGSGYGVWDEAIVRRNLQGMKDWGINVIRISICIEWWINNFQGTLGGQPSNRTYREALKDTIRLCAEYGIYVVIAPWSVAVSEGQVKLPYPPYHNGSVLANADAFITFWVNVANELKVYPNVLFEPWNEPAGTAAEWFPIAQLCVDAIRAIPDDHIVIVQWGYAAGFQWLRTNQLAGTNILYSNHIYRAHGSFYNNGYTYDQIYDALYNDHDGWLGDYRYPLENNIAIWIGETGCWIACQPSVEEKGAFVNTLKILNEWGVGYAVWEWHICPGRPWGLLTTTNIPSPNVSGQVLIDSIASVSLPPTPQISLIPILVGGIILYLILKR